MAAMVPTTRGKNYTVDELKQVCISFLYVSQDPLTSNGQWSEKFWEKVRIHYKKHKPQGGEERGAKSLEGKWGDIKHDVRKFIGVYNQVEGLQISGTNLEDTLVKAHELYKQNHSKGKSFTYEACYHILKGCPRWSGSANEMATGKKSRSSSSNAGTDQQNSAGTPTHVDCDQSDSRQQPSDETAEIGGGIECKRPGGNKKAKEDLKRQKFDQDTLQASMRVAEDYKQAVAERNYCTQINTMMRLIMMPTASLDPEMRKFAEEFQLEEAQKLRAKIRSNAPHSPIARPNVDEDPDLVQHTSPPNTVTNAAMTGVFYTPEAAEGADHATFAYNATDRADPNAYGYGAAEGAEPSHFGYEAAKGASPNAFGYEQPLPENQDAFFGGQDDPLAFRL